MKIMNLLLIKRDTEIRELLEEKNVEVCSFKDNVIFHKDDILKKGW